jgi:hypothetical protein
MDTKPMDCGVVWVSESKGELAGQMDTKPMDWFGSATQRESLLAKWTLNQWTVVWVSDSKAELAGQMDTKQWTVVCVRE